MFSSKKTVQASKQASWRRQAHMIALILGGVAIFGLVSALYLDVTARAATAGRSVQDLQDTREDLEQSIEDKQSQLAHLRSVQVMQQRAEKLGFTAISPSTVLYVEVDGYQGRTDAQLAPAPGESFQGGRRMPAEYTRSLFDWVGNVFSVLGGF